MKFGYDADGKLVPSEQLELEAKIAELEAELDNRTPSERSEDVQRLSAVLVNAGQSLSEDDKNVLVLYQEGVIDMHNVEHHFGERLVAALEHLQRGSNDAA